jgi:ABC-type nitrate/sulfonate/bicarbonate transport system substrate-binding protein
MRRTALIAVAVIATISLLAACRRASDKPVASGQVINLSFASIPHASLVEVALDRGFFATEGLIVHATPFAFGKLALASVIDGKADLATVAETPIVLAILAGEQIAISAVIETSDSNTALVASDAQGVKSPSDLAGKAIGVPLGTNGEYFLDAFLIARGIEKRSVHVVDLQPDQMLPAIQAGRIAAAVIWNPTLLRIKDSLADKGRVFDGSDIYTENFCITGERDFISKHPAAMRSFLRALIRAEDFMARNPEKARTIIGKYTDTDKATLVAELGNFTFRVGLDKSFFLALEDEARWAMSAHETSTSTEPNFLDYIESEALSSVAPERVRYIR